MVRLAIQRRLDRGVPWAAWLGRPWEAVATVERRLRVPVPVVCVGGATLGGSGKTPLAMACAKALGASLVGHAYGARPGEARQVTPDDDPTIVGDEAIECAREGLRVWVARDRQRAIDEAARTATVLVLDGVGQLWPERATLALLAVDAADPWGSGRCPPAGNLRASQPALLRAADLVVPIRPVSRGVWVRGELVPFAELRCKKLGLATGIARPERVVRLLERHGLRMAHHQTVADHAPIRTSTVEVDLWLITRKDAARGPAPEGAGVIDYHLDLPDEVKGCLERAFWYPEANF